MLLSLSYIGVNKWTNGIDESHGLYIFKKQGAALITVVAISAEFTVIPSEWTVHCCYMLTTAVCVTGGQ